MKYAETIIKLNKSVLRASIKGLKQKFCTAEVHGLYRTVRQMENIAYIIKTDVWPAFIRSERRDMNRRNSSFEITQYWQILETKFEFGKILKLTRVK